MPPRLLRFVMLPDRKEWFNSFIKSDRYNEIIKQVMNYPELDYLPVWNGNHVWPDADQRFLMYKKGVISLSSIYPLDYIHNQTNGGLITNITNRYNYFADMYNVQLPNGSKSFFNSSPPINFTDALQPYKHNFDNVVSVCTIYGFPLTDLDYVITNFSKMINRDSDERYGYLSLNLIRLFIHDTPEADIQKYELNKYYKLVNFIDDHVERATKKLEVLYYENLLEDHNHDDPIDGTLRLFFRVKP